MTYFYRNIWQGKLKESFFPLLALEIRFGARETKGVLGNLRKFNLKA